MKRVVYFAVRDEVAVRELFAILLSEGVYPYRILKSHDDVTPKTPDWVFRHLETGEKIHADAKEIATKANLFEYIKEHGVTVVVCWYSKLSPEFIEKYGLTVHELRHHFYEPFSFFEDKIFPIVKSKIEEALTDVNVEWLDKVVPEENNEHKSLYKFSVSRKGEQPYYFRLYCDADGLARYEELYAEEAMKRPEETARKITKHIVEKFSQAREEVHRSENRGN